MRAGNPYTEGQIVNRAKVNIINTGRYHSELKEYKVDFNYPTNKDWPTFKQFWLITFNKAKNTRKTITTEYHGAYNTMGTNDAITMTSTRNISDEDTAFHACKNVYCTSNSYRTPITLSPSSTTNYFTVQLKPSSTFCKSKMTDSTNNCSTNAFHH